MRIGHGYDVHRLKPGLPLTIGGVSLEFEKGIVAHSDGDVLLHAICDALLGAAGLGDIGQHFPDTDNRFKGISSRTLLVEVNRLLRTNNSGVGNVDATIIVQRPKMAPHIPDMRANIAADLNVDISQVNVKATTTEKLGFVGREDGIAAEAVCLIHPIRTRDDV